ncbi:MAG TPA: AraC family transcriptional regulator [Myxococcales bacterium]|nr:AraC family transcriptional regulator [Myxococcales bacterium]
MTKTPDGGPLIEEALRMVRLSSAVFLRADFTAPWAFESLGPRECAQALCPGTERLVLFHVVAEGRCEIRMQSGEAAALGPGEAVVLPYGDRHLMGQPLGTKPVPIASLLPPLPWPAPPVLRHGGGGADTRILCGYLHCEDLLFQPFLEALPALIHVRPPTPAAAEWLRASARYALEDPASWRTVGLAARLPELLFVECLRQYVAALPPARTGWLAALRDPVVGPALKALHTSPAQGWTVEMLARRAATSRTVLGERFAALLGQPPMRYLAQWRLQLAAHLLRTTAETLPAIAGRVGYESEASFSRAFKRSVGEPPAFFRSRSREGPLQARAGSG